MTQDTTSASGADDTIDRVTGALIRAYLLGQTYWRQVDSDNFADRKRANLTQESFNALVNETRAALAPPAAQPPVCQYAQDMGMAGHRCAVKCQYTVRLAPAQQDTKGEATDAVRDVLEERARQISVEGWTPESDDKYHCGDMASAAACYARQGRYHFPEKGKPGPDWPWAAEWWKPSTYRRNLEKAGALILAEIERIDRATQAERPAGKENQP